MDLYSSLDKIKGVGEKTYQKFKDAGINSVSDILKFYPRKYEDLSSITSLKDITPGKVIFKAKTEDVSIKRVRRGMTIVEATLADGSNKVKAIWFNQPYRLKQLSSDEEFYFSGIFEFKYNKYQIINPSIVKREELPKEQNFKGESGEIVPIYRQKKGLKTDVIRKILTELKPLIKMLPETLPEKIIKREKLVSRSEAVENIHFPKSGEDFNKAFRRLAFEEIFEIILASKINKIKNQKLKGIYINPALDEVKSIVDNLPFNLTNSQRLVTWEIMQDMKKEFPMNRLLQGDVGSGKTMVAILSAINIVKNGYQVAVVAPTEILATQLAENFSKILTNDISIGFLSANVKGKKRTLLLDNVKNGNINILVGTHAILTPNIEFKNLGLVIIDEQHRFGVKQRQELLKKNSNRMPHLLTMTATPIPRSLYLTLFGDLSVSILKEKPKNRKLITTSLISPNSRKPMVNKVKEELEQGRQAFVIVPAILDNDNTDLKNIEAEIIRLKAEFKGYSIGVLHGKMSSLEKDIQMQKFLNKEYHILLSTTVIEVGIDVPNASVIIIENADRFGLAQLHQLRGRVGRGDYESYCYLVMGNSNKPPERLKELVKTDDGFKLAEKDLELRGAGEIYGKAQSGELNLEFASLGDMELIAKVQNAVDWLSENEGLFNEYIKNNREDLRRYQMLTILN